MGFVKQGAMCKVGRVGKILGSLREINMKRTQKKHLSKKLSLEFLEDRTVPVIGAFADAPTTLAPQYDGVVLINAIDGAQAFIGTGSLLIDRTFILTAAHVVTNNNGTKLSGSIDFVTSSGTQSIVYTDADVFIVNGYIPNNDNTIAPNDVALIRINGVVPSGIQGYDIYRLHDEIGQTFTMVGYGQTGDGATGEVDGSSGTKRVGTNTFEATDNITEGPAFFRNLAYDFDDGTSAENTFTNDYGIPSTLGVFSGATLVETAVGAGDSGGPAFISTSSGLTIAGIVSGGTDDGVFGSTGSYARVSAFARAIDLIVGTPVGNRVTTTNFAASPGAGNGSFSTPSVHVYDSTVTNPNEPVADFQAYSPAFTGGLTLAMGDVNRDGFVDIVTGPGPGGGPNIKVFSGADYTTVLYNFFAFESTFTGGVTIASADINNDGYDDIMVGAGPGGGPRVTVFSGLNGSILQDFFAFEPTFTGGVNLAAGLIDGDSNYDIIIGAGAGGGPRVKVLSGANLSVIQDFFAYDTTFLGGVYVGSGNIGGGTFDKILVGAGAGGGPNVRVFDNSANMVQNFFAYAVGFTGGVRVSTGLMSATSTSADIITGAGIGGGPNVSTFNSLDQPFPLNFFAFSPSFEGGIFVAGRAS